MICVSAVTLCDAVDRLVHRIEELTLAKIGRKNRKSLMFNVFKQSFIYIMHNFYPSFDFETCNKSNTQPYYTISKFSLKVAPI